MGPWLDWLGLGPGKTVVKLDSKRFKAMAVARGMTAEQLAEAVTSDSLAGDRAVSAVQNWLRGSDHPRCRAPQCRALAQALGCELSDIVRFTSQVRHHRGSPRKARLLADLIRGKSVEEALNLLTFTTKRAAVNMRKCLNAAITDAMEADADERRLVVCESRVDEGPHIKRFRPKDRGRAHSILKRTSHITVSVAETVE